MQEESLPKDNNLNQENSKEEIEKENIYSFENLSSDSFPNKPKKRFFWVKVILGVFLFLVCSFVAVLASRVWDPLWNPFRPKPEKVMEKMTEKMEALKTLHSKINFEENDNFENKSLIQLDINYDGNDPKNIKTASDVSVNMNVFGLGVSYAFELKQIGESSYLKLKEIPAFLTQMMNLGELSNQWIKINEESLKNLLGEELYQKISEKKAAAEKQQEDLVKEFKKIIENKKFYLVKEELPDEKIDNKKVYHYKVVLNNEEIENVIYELGNAVGKNLGMDLSSEGFSKENINKLIEKIGEISGSVWIGKGDNFLYRIFVEKTLKLSDLEENKKTTKNNKQEEILIKLDINFSEFNKPMKIEAPDQFKKIEELLPFLGSNYGNLSQLKTIADILLYEKKSYKSLCSNSNLNKKDPVYGRELTQIEKEIKEKGGLITCYSSENSYCIEVKLSDNNTLCLDNVGISQEGDNKLCSGEGTKNNPYHCFSNKK